jgi:hypothetical protein
MEQYQHSPLELRAIADLVDAMNAFDEKLNAHSVTMARSWIPITPLLRSKFRLFGNARIVPVEE